MTDKTKENFLATIPFSGFYHSIHSDEVDRAIEMIFSDRETGTEQAPNCIWDKVYTGLDYGTVYRKYARTYAASFLNWLGLDGEFESMESPREYNFTTDRIFVNLTRNDLARIWRGVDLAEFTNRCAESFTSRSGFISYYSPDWKEWGRLSEWDHNQIGVLIAAYAETEQGDKWDQFAEYGLIEDCPCNGDIENWIWESAGPEFLRAAKIWDYIQERAGRAIKTMAAWRESRRAENRPFAATPLGAFGEGAGQ